MRQRGRVVMVLALVAATPACLESSLVPCADGTFCPSGTVCGEGTCTPAEALAGCAGSPDGTACTIAGGPGACILGVCTAQECGDGAVTGTEQCDGAAARTCEALGHHGGTLTCSAACQFDVSACRRCGDGVVEPGLETCDGAPATDCVERGYDLGPTSCTSLCNADLRRCEFTAWQRAFTASRTLVAGASAGPDDVLIAGANGYVARFDGAGWIDGTVPTEERLGEVEASTTSYWVSSGARLYRLARSASVADPAAWQEHVPPSTPVRAMHVRHDADVWLGGPGRALHAYDGAQWTAVTLPGAVAGGVNSIWRDDARSVIGMGDGKVLVSVGAAAFTTAATCAPAAVVEVWADPDGAIGAACDDDRLIRIAGAGPAEITTFPGSAWIGAEAHAGSVVVVATGGRPLWRDGGYWSWIDQPLAGADAAVITETDAFILVGTTVYQRPARWWTSTTTVDPSASVSAAWFRSEAGAVVPWIASGVTLARAGEVVPTTLSGCGNTLARIGGLAGHAPGPLFAIAAMTGGGSALLQIDAPAAAPLTLRCVVEVAQDLSTVVVSPDGAAIAVGDNGRVVIAQPAGPAQTYLGSLDGLPGNALVGAWIGSGDDAWVVGTAGAIAHWDGASWTTTPPFVTISLQGVRAWPGGEVLVVGAAGTVWQRRGGQWEALDGPPGARTLRAIDGAQPDDVWIGGLDGSLAHFDGVSWSRATLPPVAGQDIDTVQVVPGGLALRVVNTGGSVRQLRGL